MWFYISLLNFNEIGYVLMEIWIFEILPIVKNTDFSIFEIFPDLDLTPISTKSGAIVNIRYMYLWKKNGYDISNSADDIGLSNLTKS